ncbi:hypothetical protein FSARC_5292 [Fusarium sarcochroum]|uniref:Uncharacterized protein n=1 Tax=Fusarium sarcochroum TaxID=1208366 RepID=A0A8H4XAD4_9HYPO|nr:hypothetical protein FSARC_5292 [Fusarium sarcochroum]
MAQPARRPSAAEPLQDVPDPEGHPIIPDLVSFTPAVFCPIGENDKFRDTLNHASFTKLDRLQAELEAVDARAITTRDNFLAMCVRERERIFQEGRRFEALDKQTNKLYPDVVRGIAPHELDGMIANMEAQPKSSSENVPQVPDPQFDLAKSRTLRERQATQLMMFAESSALIGERREEELSQRRTQLQAGIKEEQLKQDQERRAS